MKKFVYFLSAITMLVSMAACSKDDDMPDDDVIWDIAPADIIIQLVDEEGNNLLDPKVEGNWIDEPMWVECRDEAYGVEWARQELTPQTRAYLPHFYGAQWSGIWSDKVYSIYIGEFDGASSQDLKLTFGITAINTVYEFEFYHRLVWKNKEPHFDEHITYNAKKIEGNTLTLILPKRQ